MKAIAVDDEVVQIAICKAKKQFSDEVTLDEMAEVAGGHPFEEKFADYALYRAGITCEIRR